MEQWNTLKRHLSYRSVTLLMSITGAALRLLEMPMSERSNDGPAGPKRVFCAGGYQWTVYELPPAADGWRGKSLVFSREHVVRRVWSYPENWISLSDEELGHLVECR